MNPLNLPTDWYLSTNISLALCTEILHFVQNDDGGREGKYVMAAFGGYTLRPKGATTTLGPTGPVKLQNPPAEGPVNLENLLDLPADWYLSTNISLAPCTEILHFVQNDDGGREGKYVMAAFGGYTLRP